MDEDMTFLTFLLQVAFHEKKGPQGPKEFCQSNNHSNPESHRG